MIVGLSSEIPVYGIAAMIAAGATDEELLAGYPRLTKRLLDLAVEWVAGHPRSSKPETLGDLGLVLKSRKRVPRKSDPLAGVRAGDTLRSS